MRALGDAGIDAMVTGSVASSLQGEPRATHDIDLVVRLGARDVPGVVALFPPPDFYISETAVREALARQSMFNVVSLADGDKLDFWILTESEFDRSRFQRRVTEHIFGVDVEVSAPEDTLLMKLLWARQSGGSEKQFTDALRIYEVQGSALDQSYLDLWAAKLDVETLLQKIRAKARLAD